MPTAASPAASLPALTTGHVEALVDAEAASALPLLVLVPCLSHQWTPTAWCASEAEAERAVVAVSQRHPNEFNAARAGPGMLPLASLGLSPHADLPALRFANNGAFQHLYVRSDDLAGAGSNRI